MHLFLYKNMFLQRLSQPYWICQESRTSASQYGHTWAEMLGNFHTRSYYTGSRAVPDVHKRCILDQEWMVLFKRLIGPFRLCN